MNLLLIGLLTILMATSGCSNMLNRQTIPPPSKKMTYSATGAVAGALIGSYTAAVPVAAATLIGGMTGAAVGEKWYSKNDHLAAFNTAGIQLFKVGEYFLLILPSDHFFYPHSAHINEAFYPVLNHIAAWLAELETDNIKVAGYTDTASAELPCIALSRQQADEIMNYLWQRGLNARMMYSIGYGAQLPVASNAQARGRTSNRRIEITFHQLNNITNIPTKANG